MNLLLLRLSTENVNYQEINVTNLDTDFQEAVPKQYDTTFSPYLIPTLHRETLIQTPIWISTQYKRTQLFIHYHLVQHKTLSLFMWLSYHDTKLCGYHDTSYLIPVMSWYVKRGGSTWCLWVLWCCHVATSTLFMDNKDEEKFELYIFFEWLEFDIL